MDRRFVEIPASALSLFVVGYALWPPGRLYWTALADVVGTVITSAVVMLVAGLVGVGIAALSDVPLPNLAAAGALAYAAGMALIAVALTPESPVHFYLYGWLLGCLLLGAIAVRYRDDGVSPA